MAMRITQNIASNAQCDNCSAQHATRDAHLRACWRFLERAALQSFSPQSQRGPYKIESCTHARARKRAAHLQSSVIAQLTALCVAARQQRLRHISQNVTLATLSSTSTAAPQPPSAGGHRVYTAKKCERVDAHCRCVYTVKAHPRQAGKLNSS
jgi:hypothetical protein